MKWKKTYIDGYNVLRKIDRFSKLMKSDADAARRGFVEYVRSRFNSSKAVTIVFDGSGESIAGGKTIRIVFSLTRSADSWIKLELEKELNRQSVLVVSSDLEIRSHASAVLANVLFAEEFIGLVEGREPVHDAEDIKTMDRDLSKSEIEMWMKELSSKGRNENVQNDKTGNSD